MKFHLFAYIPEEFQYSQRIPIKEGNKTCSGVSQAIILLLPYFDEGEAFPLYFAKFATFDI